MIKSVLIKKTIEFKKRKKEDYLFNNPIYLILCFVYGYCVVYYFAVVFSGNVIGSNI